MTQLKCPGLEWQTSASPAQYFFPDDDENLAVPALQGETCKTLSDPILLPEPGYQYLDPPVNLSAKTIKQLEYV